MASQAAYLGHANLCGRRAANSARAILPLCATTGQNAPLLSMDAGRDIVGNGMVSAYPCAVAGRWRVRLRHRLAAFASASFAGSAHHINALRRLPFCALFCACGRRCRSALARLHRTGDGGAATLSYALLHAALFSCMPPCLHLHSSCASRLSAGMVSEKGQDKRALPA